MIYDRPPPQHCPDCDLTFALADPTDRRWHRTVHRRFERLAQRLGRWPAGKQERERMKDEGDRLRREATLLKDKAAGAEMVLRGLYHRELHRRAHALCLRYIPTFRAFVARQQVESLFGHEVAAFLRAQLASGWMPVP